MKKGYCFIIGLLFLASILINSCKKDDDQEPDTATKLTTGKWFLEKKNLVIKIDDLPEETESLEDCEKDDYIEFKTDSTAIENYGEVSCNDDNESEKINKWSLRKNSKELVLYNKNGNSFYYNIDTITNNRLELSIAQISTTFSFDEHMQAISHTITINGSIIFVKK